MKLSVWIAAKPGEPRVFTTAGCWGPETLRALRSEGFRIFRTDVEFPPDFSGHSDGELSLLGGEEVR